MAIFFNHMAGIVGLALLMAGCGPTAQPRPVMPEAQYAAFADNIGFNEHCYTTNRINAEDIVALRQAVQENLAAYQYDAARLQLMVRDIVARYAQAEADPAVRPRIKAGCANMARTAATNRVTFAQRSAAQLQQAQLATAYAQRQAALTPTYTPQPYVMSPMPTFQAPQVQTPVFGGNRTTVFCNRLTDTITTCR